MVKIMTKVYTIEQIEDTRWFYTFAEPNAKGETLIVELTKCEDDPNWKNSNPKLWKKKGCMDRVLETYWSISTYVRDTEGNCYGIYNPQDTTEYHSETNSIRSVIDFDWMFEATEENKERLINEVYRLFSSAQGKTATEEKIEAINKFAEERAIEVVKELPEGWKILKGALTAPKGATWVSNMKTIKSGERKSGLLLIN